jgi:hypothetical protein
MNGTRRTLRAPKRWAPLRVLLAALVVGVATSAATSAIWSDNTSSCSATPLTVSGVGSWAPYRLLVSWQNALICASSPIDMQYVHHGTVLGRADLLQGNADFVISGRPFTSDELQQLPNGSKDLIDAPIEVASMGMLVGLPFPTKFTSQVVKCNPDDPDTWPPDVTDPNQCLVRTPYTGDSNPTYKGDLPIPADNLAAMLFHFPARCPAPASGNVVGVRPLNGWYCYPVLSAFGLPETTTWVGYPSLAMSPTPVLRSDADEMNYYMQQFIFNEAHSTWQALKDSTPTINWEPITERIPHVAGVGSRDGAGDQAQQLGIPGVDPLTGGTSSAFAGTIAPVPASSRGDVEGLGPSGNPVTWAEVQIMHNSQWVAPTPDSINADVDAAVAAGTDPFLYSFNNDVANAYPLVWIDHLYVRSSGLSIEKTEALATLIRYLATDGQTPTASVGEGRLPAPLVKQALAAADQVVDSNCTQPGAQKIKNSDPGPDAPSGPGMKAIGSMLHCVAGASTPSSTAAQPFSSSANSSSNFSSSAPLGSSSFSSLNPAVLPAGPTASGAASTPSEAPKKSSKLSAALTVSNLPLPEPSPTGKANDVIATALAGAAGFLLLRIPARRLLKVAQR